jgi:hypothetical protein
MGLRHLWHALGCSCLPEKSNRGAFALGGCGHWHRQSRERGTERHGGAQYRVCCNGHHRPGCASRTTMILRENESVCFFVLSAICLFQLTSANSCGLKGRAGVGVEHYRDANWPAACPAIWSTLTGTADGNRTAWPRFGGQSKRMPARGEKIEPTLRLLYQAVRVLIIAR